MFQIQLIVYDTMMPRHLHFQVHLYDVRRKIQYRNLSSSGIDPSRNERYVTSIANNSVDGRLERKQEGIQGRALRLLLWVTMERNICV